MCFVSAANVPFLLLALRRKIVGLDLNESVSTASHASSFRLNMIYGKVISMDFDSKDGIVYWVQQSSLSSSSESLPDKV